MRSLPDNLIEQTIEAGINPLELEYHPLKSTESGEECGLLSVLRINSLELGAIYPEQYRYVTAGDDQGIRLATRNYRLLLPEMKKSKGLRSLYFPVKMLLDGSLERLLQPAGQRQPEILSRLILEFSQDILLSDSVKTAKRLSAVKELGVKLLLDGYGDDFCPLLRLGGLPFDMVALDGTYEYPAKLNSEQAEYVVSLIRGYGISAVLKNAGSEEAVLRAREIGCEYYSEKPANFPDEVTADAEE